MKYLQEGSELNFPIHNAPNSYKEFAAGLLEMSFSQDEHVIDLACSSESMNNAQQSENGSSFVASQLCTLCMRRLDEDPPMNASMSQLITENSIIYCAHRFHRPCRSAWNIYVSEHCPICDQIYHQAAPPTKLAMSLV
jgi:hypothetical protein